MIVYKIQNLVNGKCYIGQSINSFKRRYDKTGNWSKATGNEVLKNAAKKYGLDKFSVVILEQNVESFEKLDELEKYYIKIYNSIHPYGYNFLPGGEGYGSRQHHKKTREKMSYIQSRGRINKLKNHKTGEIVEFINIQDFSKKYNLSPSMVFQVIHKRYKKHKNWTLPETKLEYWVAISPEGIKFKIFEGEAKEFCRKHDLYSVHFFKNSKLNRTYKGWTINKYLES